MTCEQFKDFHLKVPITSSTRAERFAGFIHWGKCYGCRTWLDEAEKDNKLPGERVDTQQMVVDDLLASDPEAM